MKEPPRVGILTGVTASGKTAIALEFCRRHPNVEILNADSMLVYRKMDIGTAKPEPKELSEIRHHLIDIRDPDQPYTAADFYRDTQQTLKDAEARGKRILIVGGTGFYLKALLYGLWEAPPTQPDFREKLANVETGKLFQELLISDPQFAQKIGPHDRYRMIRALEILEFGGQTPSQLEEMKKSAQADSRFALWALDRPQEELIERIHQRTRLMIRAGMIDEVRTLRSLYPNARALQAVGYAEVSRFLQGIVPEGRKVMPGTEGLTNEINLATRQLVKRQRTWFKGEKTTQFFQLDQERDRLWSTLEEWYGFHLFSDKPPSHAVKNFTTEGAE